MASNVSCGSSTPLGGVDGNPDVDAKRQNLENVLRSKSDQWNGLFGEGGYLWGNIDTAKAVWPLAIWCFLTGFMSVIPHTFFPLGDKEAHRNR